MRRFGWRDAGTTPNATVEALTRTLHPQKQETEIDKSGSWEVTASMLLILAHDRPFTGELAVNPNPILQVMPA